MKSAHLARMSKTCGASHVRSTALTVAALACALAACGGNESGSGGGDPKAPSAKRSTAIEHEPCDGAGANAIDVNNDGKPDIRRVMGGGREVCRVTDLNRNGKPDLYQYFDQAGNLRRREADYDESGVVDAIEHYENGKLVRVEYDTLARHKLDTWDYFDPATGKRVRRERDSRGTGQIDQWWTWEGEKVSIAFDRDGDGQPDPSETLVLGEGGRPTTTTAADAAPPPSTASTLGQLDGGSTAVTTMPTAEPATPLDAGPPSKTPRGKK